MSKKAINATLTALIAATMVAGVACSGNTDQTGAPNDQATTAQDTSHASVAYDGEAIFRGVFFGSGPVAKLLPEVWENPDIIQMRENAKHMTPEMAADRLDEASLVYRNGGDTESADRAVTQAKQLRAGEVTVDAVVRQGDEETAIKAIVASIRTTDPQFFDGFATEMQSGDHVRVQAALENGAEHIVGATQSQQQGTQANPGNNCFFVAIGVAVAAGYVAVVAAGVAVSVAAVFVHVKFWNAMSAGSAKGLQRDVLIDDLTDRLVHF